MTLSKTFQNAITRVFN